MAAFIARTTYCEIQTNHLAAVCLLVLYGSQNKQN